MKFNRKEKLSFVQKLDRTAENNPLLWLPCVIALTVIIGTDWVCDKVKSAISQRMNAYYAEPQIRRKPFALRALAATVAVAFAFMLVPELNVLVYAEEVIEVNTDGADTEAVPIEDGSSEDPYDSNDEVADDEKAFTFDETAALFSTGPTGYGIIIDADNFPDPTFRQYVSDFDTDRDGYLSEAEVGAVKSISVDGENIGSLRGIEYFSSLERLNCRYNNLTELDVSGCAALTNINCRNNELTSLHFSQNSALEVIDCQNNRLSSLDVSECLSLTTLDCKNNQLTSLNVSGCSVLRDIWCNDNQLSVLDISGCTALKFLYCNDNQLGSLDFSTNTALYYLYCYNNKLTSLKFGYNRDLSQIHCYNNLLMSLDVGGCASLNVLDCSNNQLTSLDLSNNSLLRDDMFGTLNVGNNVLPVILINGIYSLSALESSGFDPAKASNWQGAAYNSADNSLADFTGTDVTYDYDCGNGKTVTFSLTAEDNIHSCIFGEAWEQDEKSHWHECTCGEKSGVAAHITSDWIVQVPPTEDDEGAELRVCTVCNRELETRSIDKLDCSHANTTASTTDATCTSEGKTEYICDKCGEVVKTETIPRKEHILSDWTVKTPPTEDTEGIEIKICTVCGKEIETRVIGTLECSHAKTTENVVEPTCTADGIKECICDKCGEKVAATVIPAKGHTPGDWTVKIPATEDSAGVEVRNCTVCGEELETRDIEKLDCTHKNTAEKITEATCVTDGIKEYFCEKCRAKVKTAIIPAKGHASDDGKVTVQPSEITSGVKTYSCTVCGQIIRTETIPATGYSYPVSPVTLVDTVFPENISRESIDWDAVINNLMLVPDGGSLTVNMNGTNILPESVLACIIGKNIDLILIMSNGMKWIINGMSVTAPKTLNMGVTSSIRSNIPDDLLDSVSEEYNAQALFLDYSGEFGCIAMLTIDIGKKYDGLCANLFYYNRNANEQEYVCFSFVNDGKATFMFTHASEYAAVISDLPLGGVYEDIAAGAGIIDNSITIDLTTPVTNGVSVPAVKLPQIPEYSTKKRRYRIIRKRKLDDLVFVY